MLAPRCTQLNASSVPPLFWSFPSARAEDFTCRTQLDTRNEDESVANDGKGVLTSNQEMADKLGLGSEVRELKLGPTFTSRNPGTAFHTLKYDFKPASVDVKKMASVDVGSNNQVTVTVPHLDGAGTTHTVFKGNRKPYQKECVLIIDHSTGEITLEKLSSNIQLKKTRSEGPSKLSVPRPNTPVEVSSKKSSPHQKSSPYHHSAPTPPHTSSKPYCSPCVPRHSPLQASPPLPGRSPPASTRPARSPNYAAPSVAVAPPSLPMIGLDDGPSPAEPDFCIPNEEAPLVGVLSDSSSDSSSDSASSDSESEPEKKPPPRPPVNGHVNGRGAPAAAVPVPVAQSAPPLSMPDHLLNEDLQLSESGSDSD